jgi:hypothetical protein
VYTIIHIESNEIVLSYIKQISFQTNQIGTLIQIIDERCNIAQMYTCIHHTQGGPDSYVGMIGSGAVEPGQLVLITGSSHLQLSVCGEGSRPAPGIWVRRVIYCYLCF